MTAMADHVRAASLARMISADLSTILEDSRDNFARDLQSASSGSLYAQGLAGKNDERPQGLLDDYDHRVSDPDLVAATRSRFATKHYADAVESGVKVLNDCVRKRTGCSEDGDSLMTRAFSPGAPMLRVKKASVRDDSMQRGHMMLCQGVVAAWRNPRAHSLIDDSPERALMMLETIQDLIQVTRQATRTRKPKKRP